MNTQKRRKSIAVLVAAHNEELVLSETLTHILKSVKNTDLYIVNDGSTDKTISVAKRFTKNILSLKSAHGKATALNTAIAYFKLVSKYEFIFPVDADTKINANFIQRALAVFKKDTKKETVCVIGKVVGEANNWLTTYRLWEYEVTQLIHKSAQRIEKAIMVCPGCSTIYRSSLFAKIQIPSDTIVEDMDLTLLIHRKKLGNIEFINRASVVTQDPFTLKDYVKQIKRWYGGYWQCLKKHSIPWGRQTLDLELLMLTIEGLSGGILTLLLFFALPFILAKHPFIFAVPLALDFALFLFPTLFITIFIHSTLKPLKYLPVFYFMRILNNMVFLYTFAESVFMPNSLTWKHPSRYQIKEGKVCTAQ